MRYRDLTCDKCGFETIYDITNTWYFKCPNCGKVLVDVDLDEKIIEDLNVFDYKEAYNVKIF